MMDPRKRLESFISVFRSHDETAAAVAQSILEEAGISCTIKGGLSTDATGISRLGTMFTPGLRPVEVFVLESDEEEASRLLTQLQPEHGEDRS